MVFHHLEKLTWRYLQKILDHIEAQPPPLKPATAIQS